MFYQASRAQNFACFEVWSIKCTSRFPPSCVQLTVSCAVTVVSRFCKVGITLRSSVITESKLCCFLSLYSIMFSSDYVYCLYCMVGCALTVACLFCTVSCTVILSPFHSPVAFAMSSPTFLGDRPRGPT
jgi:hypothetical protein